MDSTKITAFPDAAQRGAMRRRPGREWIGLFAALAASGASLAGAWLAAGLIQHFAPAIAPQSPAPVAATNIAPPALIEMGHQDFQMSCSNCHGDDAHGDEGPDLHGLTISDARIAVTIRHGVKGEMPSFGKKFNEPDVQALIAFLRSLSPDRTAGS